MRRLMFSLAAVAALSLGGGAAHEVVAGEISAAIPAGVKVLTAQEIKALQSKATVYIFDSRDKTAYEKAHIEGAASLPLSSFDLAQLPKDKAAQIVFYCGGPSCPLAPTSAGKARAAGYENVAVYHEGIETWNKLNGKKS